MPWTPPPRHFHRDSSPAIFSTYSLPKLIASRVPSLCKRNSFMWGDEGRCRASHRDRKVGAAPRTGTGCADDALSLAEAVPQSAARNRSTADGAGPARRCARGRGRLAGALALLFLLHVAGSSAQGIAPSEAEDVSFLAQEAAAASVAKEVVDRQVNAHRAGAKGASEDGEDGDGDGDGEDAEDGGGEEGGDGGVIYSQDGTWTLPQTALAAGAACKPHCTGQCMEHCQFKANKATGEVEDTKKCAADCKEMCKRGCRQEPAEAGGKQHGESLAARLAEEAEEGAHLSNPEETTTLPKTTRTDGEDGGEDGGEDDGGDREDGPDARTDGVGVNSHDRSELPMKDCIPSCIAECFPACERPSTKDPHICKVFFIIVSFSFSFSVCIFLPTNTPEKLPHSSATSHHDANLLRIHLHPGRLQ